MYAFFVIFSGAYKYKGWLGANKQDVDGFILGNFTIVLPHVESSF